MYELPGLENIFIEEFPNNVTVLCCDSLVSHYSFPKPLWLALKTANSVERINKEFKRRSKSMDSLGELRVKTLVAFTAMLLELGWRRRAVDTYDKQLLNRRTKFLTSLTLQHRLIYDTKSSRHRIFYNTRNSKFIKESFHLCSFEKQKTFRYLPFLTFMPQLGGGHTLRNQNC